VLRDPLRYVARRAVPRRHTGAPLLANVYPYFAYKGEPGNISLDFATFRPGAALW
jgi:hypothetical protein